MKYVTVYIIIFDSHYIHKFEAVTKKGWNLSGSNLE